MWVKLERAKIISRMLSLCCDRVFCVFFCAGFMSFNFFDALVNEVSGLSVLLTIPVIMVKSLFCGSNRVFFYYLPCF